MLITAQRVRTSLVIGAATATITAILLLTPRDKAVAPPDGPQSELIVSARTTSTKIVAGEQHLAITITAPHAPRRTRPPLSLAVVIDRSGSMYGEPLRNAKAAAEQLVDQLDGGDAFTIVTYSSGDETVMPMARATAENKARAKDAIDAIYDDGNTCISCGLERGARELARTPVEGGLQRIVLISDGQANAGISDRGELVDYARVIAARGTSISTVGVGLDFDEVTMAHLAQVGRGNYYFVEDTAALGAMFAQELGGLADTFATNVRLILHEGDGVTITDAYGYPLVREGGAVLIPVADLRAGETRKVVLRATVTGGTGERMIAGAEVAWRRSSDGAARASSASARATVVGDPAEVAATIDQAALQAVAEARASHALDEATATYERQGADAAERVLRRQLDDIQSAQGLAAPAKAQLEQLKTTTVEHFATSPAPRALKAARKQAFDLAR